MNSYSTITMPDGTHHNINAEGIYLSEGGASELFTLPTCKAELYNDWQESDGMEVDFESIRVLSPEIRVNFVLTSKAARMAFNEYHKARSFVLEPAHWGHSFRLTNPEAEGGETYGKLTNQSLIGRFGMRYQLEDTPQLPEEGVLAANPPLEGLRAYVSINGTDLSDYGIAIQRAYESLLSPETYKAFTYKRKPREVQLHCMMMADTWQELWTNRAVLWSALQGELEIGTIDGSLKAYYLSMADVRQVGKRPIFTFIINLQTI